MTSFYGYNIHAQGVAKSTYLIEHVIKTKPAWLLVMDGLALAQQLKAASPDTNVIHRNFGVVNGDADVFARVSPQAWLDLHKPEIDAGVWLMTTCEPGWGQDIINWHIALMKLCIPRKIKLVVGNFSVGTPDPNAIALAKPLFQLMADNSDLFVLGLHEYANAVITSGFVGGAPNGKTQGGLSVHVDYTLPGSWPYGGETRILTKWHCGRFQFIVDYCKSVGIKPPRIVLSENGFDDVSDIKWWTDTLPKTAPYANIRGYKTLQNYWKQIFPQWSHDQAYFKQLEYAANNIYDNTVVEGAMVYCYGHKDAQWEQFDIEGRAELLGYMEAYAVAQNNTTPNYTPQPFTVGSKYTLQSVGGERTNVRSAPIIDLTNKIGLIEDKTVVKILSETAIGVDWWARISTDTIQDGYINLRGGSVTFTPLPVTAPLLPVVTPPPVDAPPSDPVPVVPAPTVPFLEVSSDKAKSFASLYSSLADTYAAMATDCRKLANDWQAVADQTTATPKAA